MQKVSFKYFWMKEKFEEFRHQTLSDQKQKNAIKKIIGPATA
jgi:hypothetical protein